MTREAHESLVVLQHRGIKRDRFLAEWGTDELGRVYTVWTDCIEHALRFRKSDTDNVPFIWCDVVSESPDREVGVS